MIELQGLDKSYPRGVHAVRGIDLTIAPRETVALLGPNGAGKSTTIDLLLGLQRPDRGTVSLFGRTPEQAIAAGMVGAMLQVGSLIGNLTVAELVAMMASLYPDPLSLDEVLDLTGVRAFAGQRAHKLSGGQTQRARAALALVSNPELLVLDEPTAALDVQARRDFWLTMRGFADRGKTVVFATHNLDEADAQADRIVLLAEGRIVADGPTGEVKSRVQTRTIRFTLTGARAAALRALDGVAEVEVHGSSVTLTCTDSDRAIRALLPAHPGARDIEIAGAGLEQAFLALTEAA